MALAEAVRVESTDKQRGGTHDLHGGRKTLAVEYCHRTGNPASGVVNRIIMKARRAILH
jgi:hypothetical protein